MIFFISNTPCKVVKTRSVFSNNLKLCFLQYLVNFFVKIQAQLCLDQQRQSVTISIAQLRTIFDSFIPKRFSQDLIPNIKLNICNQNYNILQQRSTILSVAHRTQHISKRNYENIVVFSWESLIFPTKLELILLFPLLKKYFWDLDVRFD